MTRSAGYRWRGCAIGAVIGLIAAAYGAMGNFDGWMANWSSTRGAMSNIETALVPIGMWAIIGFALGLLKDRRVAS